MNHHSVSANTSTRFSCDDIVWAAVRDKTQDSERVWEDPWLLQHFPSDRGCEVTDGARSRRFRSNATPPRTRSRLRPTTCKFCVSLFHALIYAVAVLFWEHHVIVQGHEKITSWERDIMSLEPIESFKNENVTSLEHHISRAWKQLSLETWQNHVNRTSCCTSADHISITFKLWLFFSIEHEAIMSTDPWRKWKHIAQVPKVIITMCQWTQYNERFVKRVHPEVTHQ